MESAAIGIVVLIYAVFILIMLAAGIAMYVLEALGMYTIAKRRGIDKPFLAWIPVASVWILGSIADQYDEAVKGVKKKSRVLLLSLSIATYAVAIIVSVAGIIFEFAMIGMLAAESIDNTGGTMIIVLVVSMIILVVMMALSITTTVFMYIAYYKVFKSCRPDMAVVFLILSIFIGMALPICVFICRKDDNGLPQEEVTA